MTAAEIAPEIIPGRPSWWSRQYIEPFTWDEDEMWEVVKTRNFAAVSWVTKEQGPVTALMSYIWIPDTSAQGGHIWITSTTNRHKFQAWKRNPQICLCIWKADDTQQQATVRGRVEIYYGDAVRKMWISTFINRPGLPERNAEQMEREYSTFDSPNRWFMKIHIDRWRTYDGHKMRRAENEGIDVWGEWDFPQGH